MIREAPRDVQIFLQARMSSTRFPGKVLAQIAGKSVFERTIERLRQVKGASKIVLVTSELPENDRLETEAENLGVAVFRGAEENTLDRFYWAARKFLPDAIVRVTGDCPLIDPELIDEGIRLFLKKGVDFLSNTHFLSHPHGMQFEITRRKTLFSAWEAQRAQFADEQTFKNAPVNAGSPIMEDESFKKEYMVHKPNLAFIRITLDYPEDLELIRRVYELLPEEQRDFSDIVDLFKKRPELLLINKNRTIEAGK